jgi:hypothetical protein
MALGMLFWSGDGGAEPYAVMRAVDLPDAEVAAPILVVTEPASWQSGDGMVMLLVGAADRGGLRGRLVTDLVQERRAVAELVFAPDLEDPPAIARDARRALVALRTTMAPGEVHLVGAAWDAGGRAAMLPADLQVPSWALPAEPARFATRVTFDSTCSATVLRAQQQSAATVTATATGGMEIAPADGAVAWSILSMHARACALAMMRQP